MLKNELHKLLTPAERVYTPSDKEVCKHILLDEFRGSKRVSTENSSNGEEVLSNTLTVRYANTKDNENIQEGVSEAFNDTDNVNEDRCAGLNKSTESSGSNQYRDIDGACCAEMLTSVSQTTATKGNKEESVIVCLGGAFNPVHTRHAEVLEKAIQWLEDNTDYHIVGGRLAIAPDGYVKSKYRKSGDLCMKAEHRIKLCELTCEGHKMIKPYHKPVGSAMDCGKHVTWGENLKRTRIAVIVGADRAMSKKNNRKKWQSKNKCITLVVGRKGETDEVKAAYKEDCKAGNQTDPNFFIIDKELDNVSSTAIRHELQQANGTVDAQQTLGVRNDDSCNESTPYQPDLENETDHETVKDIETTAHDKRTDDIAIRADNATKSNCQARAVDKEPNDSSTRIRVVEDLVKRGWIVESAGQYIIDNFSDLYL